MADGPHSTEILWREFMGYELDRIVEPRAAALLVAVRRNGRKLMMGVRIARLSDGRRTGDCRALWKTVRA